MKGRKVETKKGRKEERKNGLKDCCGKVCDVFITNCHSLIMLTLSDKQKLYLLSYPVWMNQKLNISLDPKNGKIGVSKKLNIPTFF